MHSVASSKPTWRRRLLWMVPILLLAMTVLAWWPHVGDAPAAGVTHVQKSSRESAAAGNAVQAPAAVSSVTAMSAETISATKSAEDFKAHRATSAQLLADEERLQYQPDLSPLASELQDRARTGDSDAAFTLAKLYQACAAALMSKWHTAQVESFLDGMRVMDISDAELTAIRGQFDALKLRCDKFAAGPVLAVMSETWMVRARELGHPGARLQQKPPRSGSNSPARAEFERLNRNAGIEVLQARNPWDLARYSEALTRHSPYMADAFLFAACQLNEACAVDPGAWSLNRAGLWILDGDGASLINLRNLAPRRRLIVEGQAAELVRLWRAGEFEQILRGNPLFPVPGGG